MKIKTLEKFIYYLASLLASLFVLIYFYEYIIYFLILLLDNYDKVFPYVFGLVSLYFLIKIEENTREIMYQISLLKNITRYLRSIDNHLHKKFTSEEDDDGIYI